MVEVRGVGEGVGFIGVCVTVAGSVAFYLGVEQGEAGGGQEGFQGGVLQVCCVDKAVDIRFKAVVSGFEFEEQAAVDQFGGADAGGGVVPVSGAVDEGVPFAGPADLFGRQRFGFVFELQKFLSHFFSFRNRFWVISSEFFNHESHEWTRKGAGRR
jgi:hypothetical protein